jgi:two-component system response regulator PhcR
VLRQSVDTGQVFRILEKPLRRASVSDTLQMAIERYHERAIQNQRLAPT